MASERPFIARTEGRMGELYVGLRIENERGGTVSCRAMVDTGACQHCLVAKRYYELKRRAA